MANIKPVPQKQPPRKQTADLQFLLEPQPALWRFATNLAAYTAAWPESVPKWAWMHSPMFSRAFLRRGDPTRGLLLSVLFHVVILSGIISAPLYWPERPQRRSPVPAISLSPHEVIYYTKADLLPLISPAKATPVGTRAIRKPAQGMRRPERRSEANPVPAGVPVKLAYHPVQRIESRPPAPDNRKQTIIQPEAPTLPSQSNVRVPNLISWSSPAIPPAPPVPVQLRPKVVEPPPPPPPKPPVARTMPEAPKLPATRVSANLIPLTPATPIEAPKLPVPVHVNNLPAKPEAPPKIVAAVIRSTRELPVAPSVEAGVSPVFLPELVAISVAPAPPEEKVEVPKGSRAGEFAAAPEGSGDESDITSMAAAEARQKNTRGNSAGRDQSAESGGELAGNALAAIHVPGLSVSGGSPLASPSATPDRDAGADLKKLMASASRPSLLPPARQPASSPQFGKERPIEAGFFGVRRVYTVYMNMPNLSSGEGSWVLRFAEMNGSRADSGELATPEAIHKVDPMYDASAAREKVQGTVTLAAVVLKDGSVANVRVLSSLDPRLDMSAVAALTQWRFHPGLKNGSPVDLEVLVDIPFRLASKQGF